MVVFTKTLSEPWFTLVKIGVKKCEGRLNDGAFAQMKKGDIIIFENDNFGRRSFSCKITAITNYPTFKQYLETETLARCLPGIDSIHEGTRVYYKYYKKEDEQRFGVRAISLKRTVLLVHHAKTRANPARDSSAEAAQRFKN